MPASGSQSAVAKFTLSIYCVFCLYNNANDNSTIDNNASLIKHYGCRQWGFGCQEQDLVHPAHKAGTEAEKYTDHIAVIAAGRKEYLFGFSSWVLERNYLIRLYSTAETLYDMSHVYTQDIAT